MKSLTIIPELFSRTYQIIRYNLILVQPLLLFLLLIGFIIPPMSIRGFATSAGTILAISIIGLYCAFLAGWFSMFHKTVELSDKVDLTNEEKATQSLGLFKEFLPGVGKYFFKILFGLIIYIVLFFAVLNIIGFIAEKYIGLPQSIPFTEFTNPHMTQEKAAELMSKISEADKIRIVKLELITMALTGLFLYLTMFWAQAVVVDNNNSIFAYFTSLKTVLKRPVTTCVIFVSCWASILAIIILSSLASVNFLIQFIGLMLLILVIVYFTMMTFLYFEKYRKNISISRTDSFR